MGIRPIGDLDIVYRLAPAVIANPSVYYTTQDGASELVMGAQVRVRMSSRNSTPAEFIFGMYVRAGDAYIGMAGIKIGPVQFEASYDLTSSQLSPYNAGYGATEFSLIYQQPYGKNKDRIAKQFSCPRFF